MGIDVWLPRGLIGDHQQAPEIITETIDSWESLQTEIAQCTLCGLCETRRPTGFDSGNHNADWMIIGTAPGPCAFPMSQITQDNADLLLTEMLRALDLDREEVFITTAVKCNPPDNREPDSHELETCKTYLLRQQALIKPKIILALGHAAAQALLNTDEPIETLRGKTHTLNDTPVVVTYHPADLLKSLLDKRKAWTDLKFAIQIIKKIKGKSCGEY
jgi:DNA polymerase